MVWNSRGRMRRSWGSRRLLALLFQRSDWQLRRITQGPVFSKSLLFLVIKRHILGDGDWTADLQVASSDRFSLPAGPAQQRRRGGRRTHIGDDEAFSLEHVDGAAIVDEQSSSGVDVGRTASGNCSLDNCDRGASVQVVALPATITKYAR